MPEIILVAGLGEPLQETFFPQKTFHSCFSLLAATPNLLPHPFLQALSLSSPDCLLHSTIPQLLTFFPPVLLTSRSTPPHTHTLALLLSSVLFGANSASLPVHPLSWQNVLVVLWAVSPIGGSHFPERVCMPWFLHLTLLIDVGIIAFSLLWDCGQYVLYKLTCSFNAKYLFC